MKQNDPTDYRIDDSFERNVSSATEMTGLIPALPEDEAEIHFYNEMYHYLPDPVKTEDDDCQNIG